MGLKSANAPDPDLGSYISLVSRAALHTWPSCQTTQSSMGPAQRHPDHRPQHSPVCHAPAGPPLYKAQCIPRKSMLTVILEFLSHFRQQLQAQLHLLRLLLLILRRPTHLQAAKDTSEGCIGEPGEGSRW